MTQRPVDIREPEQLKQILGECNAGLQRRLSALDSAFVEAAQQGQQIEPDVLLLREVLQAQSAMTIALLGIVEATVRMVHVAAPDVVRFPGRN